jgi:Flp pilus assembly protein TadD
VLRDQPDSEQARYLLGLCQVLTERFDEAMATLEPLWPQRSEDVMYLYVLSIAANSAGKKDVDERALAQLVKVGGDSPEVHLILGKAYLNHQENDAAIRELQRAAEANPRLPYVHFNLGVAHVRLGDSDAAAEEEFRKDIAIEPDLPDDYAQLGALYIRMQRNDAAEQAFRQAIQYDARMGAARFGLAQIYFSEEKYAAALREADAALQIAPDSQNVHYLRGKILSRLGREDESRKELAEAQKLMNQSLGKARADLGDKSVPNPELTREPQ